MELLAVTLLVVWLVGIVASAISIVAFAKRGEGALHNELTTMLDEAPGPILAMLTVLIVFWPATLVYNIATRRK